MTSTRVSVYNWGLNEKGKVDAVKGHADFKNGAKGKVHFIPLFPGGDYEVIDTDYTNYAIVSSCS